MLGKYGLLQASLRRENVQILKQDHEHLPSKGCPMGVAALGWGLCLYRGHEHGIGLGTLCWGHEHNIGLGTPFVLGAWAGHWVGGSVYTGGMSTWGESPLLDTYQKIFAGGPLEFYEGLPPSLLSHAFSPWCSLLSVLLGPSCYYLKK